MGRISVQATIGTGDTADSVIACEALVDTGAAYLTLPTAWRSRLGQLTTLDTVDVETADQRHRSRRPHGRRVWPQPKPFRHGVGHRAVTRSPTPCQPTITGEICGPVLLRFGDFRPVWTEVLFIDMEPAHGRYEPLIGYIPLEQAQAVVDLAGHRLGKVDHVDLKRSARF